MDPITIIALASAAFKLIQQSIPAIRDAIHGGQLTPEQEAQARAEYEKLRALAGDAYSGPEYELSGR